MTKDEVVKFIIDWERENGESFNDYFSHGTIKDQDWIYFLLKHNFISRAVEIVKNTYSTMGCMDQQLLYEIYDEHIDNKFDEEAYHKNVALMADFISNNSYYTEQLEFFINEC